MDPQPVQIPVTVVYLNQKYEQSEPDGPLVPVDGNDLPKVFTCVKSPGHNWTHYYLYGTYVSHFVLDLVTKRVLKITFIDFEGHIDICEVEAHDLASSISIFTHNQDYFPHLAQIHLDEGFHEE